jgi:hypothetical protein
MKSFLVSKTLWVNVVGAVVLIITWAEVLAVFKAAPYLFLAVFVVTVLLRMRKGQEDLVLKTPAGVRALQSARSPPTVPTWRLMRAGTVRLTVARHDGVRYTLHVDPVIETITDQGGAHYLVATRGGRTVALYPLGDGHAFELESDED